MEKHRIVLEADIPVGAPTGEPSGRSRLLHDAWTRRREADWRLTAERIPARGDLRTHVATGTLGIVTGGERADGTRIEVMRLAIDVATDGVADPADAARRMLDLPTAALPRNAGTSESTRIVRIAERGVIGPMPSGWPVGRRITDYSRSLGSYGQGGVGLSGWALNSGSWMVLPLSHSDGWITLTLEQVDPAPDRSHLVLALDQRMVGSHPSTIAAHPAWDHRYGGTQTVEDLPDWSDERPAVHRFEADARGFVMEAGDVRRNWRFEMSDRLPRAPWGGSGEPRLLGPQDDIAASFVLTHDPYLEV